MKGTASPFVRLLIANVLVQNDLQHVLTSIFRPQVLCFQCDDNSLVRLGIELLFVGHAHKRSQGLFVALSLRPGGQKCCLSRDYKGCKMVQHWVSLN